MILRVTAGPALLAGNGPPAGLQRVDDLPGRPLVGLQVAEDVGGEQAGGLEGLPEA